MGSNFLKYRKYIVIALFLVISVLSLVFMGRVSINYNISDYLDEGTETKISLGIIEEEFGMTGDVQVMIEDISVETAKGVCATLKGINNVLTVNFNEEDEGYYKNGTALFIVLVDGDEYSDVANVVVEDIKAELDEVFAGKLNYGGAVMEKASLREAMEGEIPFILAISVCLVIVIMLITSKSWLEPIVLLLASGVAILINMGTNVIFGEISYITNAVAAILQLALSIDYSIVLLHGYRKKKETEADNGKAMIGAIKEVVKPVSASALTTMAGLLALLFMSMRIGFDIGIVLMKGIVISAIVSLTLLPVLLLLLETPLKKTQKRELVLKGKFFCRMSFKISKGIVPVALALIITCGALQLGNTYSFTDTSNTNAAIADTFGGSNTVVVVYPNSADSHEKELKLAQELKGYKTADGKPVLKNFTAYSNTVRELYDVELAARKLNLSKSDVELLFTMYHLYGNNSLVNITPLDFVKYAEELMTNDADAKEFSSAEMVKTLRTMLVIDEMMNGEHTAEEFHTLATTGVMEGTDLGLFPIKQMYGLYFYDKVENPKVNFEEIIKFASNQASSGVLGNLIDEKAKESLSSLAEKLDQFKVQMGEALTPSEFQSYMLSNYGVALDTSTIQLIYASYFANDCGVVGSTIPLMDLLNFLVDMGQITDADAVSGIEQLNQLYSLDVAAFRAQMDEEMSYKDFERYMRTELGVSISWSDAWLLFAQYNTTHGTSGTTIRFLSLMNYLVSSGYIDNPASIAQVETLNQLYNTDLEGMQAQLHTSMTMDEFQNYMLTEQGVSLDDEQLNILYEAYFAYENEVVGDTIPFLSLMNYLVEKGQITDSDTIATINACNQFLVILAESYEYDELLDSFGDSLDVLVGEGVELGFDDSAIQQIYIMYFYDKNVIPNDAILGRTFVEFVKSSMASNSIVNEQLSDDGKAKLADMCVVDAFLGDTTAYNFKEMTTTMNEMQRDIQSISSKVELRDDTVSGVYIKYTVANDNPLIEGIEAKDLLDFVVANMNTNEFLKTKISEDNRSKVTEAQENIDKATGLFIGDDHSRVLLSIDLVSEGEDSSAFVVYLLDTVKDIFGEDAHIAGGMVATYDLQSTFDDDNKLITIFTILLIFIIVMLVFRSLSLPMVLVAVIQGAIWIAMSTSLITGPMFFMSYIVATCILMGATIDYGILMSTNYIQYRATLDKKESLYKSVEAAMPTVFTSGVILTICGFVIGAISSQNTIATVGSLLGKGTLVSVLMITLVLPSILYLLDGFILKLSIRKKNKNN